MSSQEQPPVTVQPVQSYYQPPQGRRQWPKLFVALIAVVLIVILATLLTIVVATGGPGSGSPEAALRGYVNGINSGNVKAALDHTIVRFVSNYPEKVSQLKGELLAFDPHISISSLVVVRNSSMTADQKAEALDDIDVIHSTLGINVTDYAFVEYDMKLSYADLGTSQTFHTDILCVKVDGSWYVALMSEIMP